jgi:L-rhamnose mutarotase
MQSSCFVMKLKADKIKEYIEIHKKGNVWPEVLENIHVSGISKMKIYILGTHAIVYTESEDLNMALTNMGKQKIQKEWNKATSDFMETQPEYDSEEIVKTLDCVFDFENGKQK